MAGKRRPHWLLRAWATFTALDLAVHIGMAKSPAHAMHRWVDDWLGTIAFALIILPVCCILATLLIPVLAMRQATVPFTWPTYGRYLGSLLGAMRTRKWWEGWHGTR